MSSGFLLSSVFFSSPSLGSFSSVLLSPLGLGGEEKKLGWGNVGKTDILEEGGASIH